MSHPKAVPPQRWFSVWRSTDRPAPCTDAADMGTAFGLDMSLLDHTPEPPAAAERRPGWMHRLTTRSRTAD
ncbi:MAG: hypothetical protein Q8K45_08950 [Rubrivivax sp.]|nr:hypothetical protein [Rubrivivax sp.]